MGTLALICCLMIFPAVVLLVGNNFDLPKKYHKLCIFLNRHGRKLGLFSIILVFTILLVIPLSQRNALIGDAETACTINSNRYIYHNVDEDRYFILHTSDWNLFNIYSVEYLDNTTAGKIIEVAEIIDGWDN